MFIIIGEHTDMHEWYFWELPTELAKQEPYIQAGDYAIVENKNDFAMVKIIAVCESKENYVRHLIGKKNKLKKVVRIVPREEVRCD